MEYPYSLVSRYCVPWPLQSLLSNYGRIQDILEEEPVTCWEFVEAAQHALVGVSLFDKVSSFRNVSFDESVGCSKR